MFYTKQARPTWTNFPVVGKHRWDSKHEANWATYFYELGYLVEGHPIDHELFPSKTFDMRVGNWLVEVKPWNYYQYEFLEMFYYLWNLVEVTGIHEDILLVGENVRDWAYIKPNASDPLGYKIHDSGGDVSITSLIKPTNEHFYGKYSI